MREQAFRIACKLSDIAAACAALIDRLLSVFGVKIRDRQTT